MEIRKQVLLSMSGIYAVSGATRGGRIKLLMATEEQGCCWELDLETLEKTRVWNGPGGAMAFADTGADGSFLAVQNFFPVFDSKHAAVVRARWDSRLGWTVRNVLNLPYLHRMDAIQTDTGKYFIGATLCSSKQSVEDWSDPGGVWVGRFEEDGCQVEGLRPLLQGLTKNHGYFHDHALEPAHAYIGCENGIYRIHVPNGHSPDWAAEQLSHQPTGDLALCDLDGDGVPEMLTIQPFHGDSVSIQKRVNGRYQTVWTYSGSSRLGHVAWGGTLLGKPAFLFGFRQGRGELAMVTYENGAFTVTELDQGEGPANVAVLHGRGRELILASTTARHEAVLYTLSEGQQA